MFVANDIYSRHLKRSELQHQSTKQSMGTLQLQVESVHQHQTEKQHLLTEQQAAVAGIRTDLEHYRALMAQQVRPYMASLVCFS